ncbi:MAG: hypothetical protein K0S09_273 [Sphingobacteriaceae bacterium]|jgi:serine/threonine-protein kinase|nr:hypothetical protein [Sphingobacteriaceae bacterium]
MAKVFTITEGLENMGAMRTGGQGSVYKGRRTGHIITAVKLLPTPIHTENEDDKNYRDFTNEVTKLKKVNEEPNPNVVKILNSGITDSGNFPYIEMEFIEGTDLEELLKPPHDPIFTIKETIKVADQLANALAHCHKVGVRHGDIKSNNVKFNVHSGNYVLLDFGLSVMSDEQRRTSLRHAGAIEFMAPEQNEGKMLFQTDIYSFGVILYELLAGRVPFPLLDNGETSRNNVMVSHLETPVPDLMELRRKNMPKNWAKDVQEREMQVPQWLIDIILKCLEKDPEKRFKDGMELHDAIVHSSIMALNSSPTESTQVAGNAVLQTENDRLQTIVAQYQEELEAKDREITRLKKTSGSATAASTTVQTDDSVIPISKTVFYALIILVVCLLAYSAYSLFSNSSKTYASAAEMSDSISVEDSSGTQNSQNTGDNQKTVLPQDTGSDNQNQTPEEAQAEAAENQEDQQPADDPTVGDSKSADTISREHAVEPKIDRSANDEGYDKYKLKVNKAYFYSQPDESTKREAFLVIWNNAELTAIDDQKGFIYVVFFNSAGQVTKGWLKKSDLTKLN